MPPPSSLDGSGGVDPADILIEEEAEAVATLFELDGALNNVLEHLPQDSGPTVIDVVVSESAGSGSSSDEWLDQEIVVGIPATSGNDSRLSIDEKNALKAEIEDDVAETLDAMLMDEFVGHTARQNTGVGSMDGVDERTIKEETQAANALFELENDLDTALGALSRDSESTEIDIIVSESDGATSSNDSSEEIDEEIVVIIPAASGSGPRLTDDEKNAIEEGILGEAGETLGDIIMAEFATTDTPEIPRHDQNPQQTTAVLPPASLTEEPAWEEAKLDEEPPSALRGAAAAFAQSDFEYPTHWQRHWEVPQDEQTWAVKLSMLTSISCMALMLLMAIGLQVRRSRRRANVTEQQFEWAQAVEYMDAFPYDP
ncbi:hypothetical protein BBJ28_00014303 [Nothophytophthora sp. Chile5]|nr:hypothetical protein BBJ28_00014303 [Nothophytophthora sp. Chile5]